MFNNKRAPNVIDTTIANSFSTSKLKQLIQNEVFDILGGIKQQIELKMKEVDQNIYMIKKDINDIKKVINSKAGNSQHQQNQNLIKNLCSKVQKMDKQIINMKNLINKNDLSLTQMSQSRTSPYKFNQAVETKNQTQKNVNYEKLYTNGPIKSNQVSNNNLYVKNNEKFNFGSIVLQQQIPIKSKTLTNFNPKSNQFSLNDDRKFTIPSIQAQSNLSQTLKKPPLPSSSNKNRGSIFSDIIRNDQNYTNKLSQENILPQELRTNQIMARQNNASHDKLQKQLSKNKSVFIRKKKSEQNNLEEYSQRKIEKDSKRNEFRQERNSQKDGYKFTNQLEDFSNSNEEQSFNIELQYSKDTFLSQF